MLCNTDINIERYCKTNSFSNMTERNYSYTLPIIVSIGVIKTKNLEDWVVVVTVSDWYDDIFQNWYKLLDLDMMMIVIAEDSKTYEKYKNSTYFETIYFDMEEVRFFNLMSKVNSF